MRCGRARCWRVCTGRTRPSSITGRCRTWWWGSTCIWMRRGSLRMSEILQYGFMQRALVGGGEGGGAGEGAGGHGGGGVLRRDDGARDSRDRADEGLSGGSVQLSLREHPGGDEGGSVDVGGAGGGGAGGGGGGGEGAGVSH